MKRKIFITFLLFIFSLIYLYKGVYFIQENDALMQEIKEKQGNYYIEPVDAIITNHTMIPGINGRKVNLQKSYQKMKKVKHFQESMLVFDKIKPSKLLENHYNKVIISLNKSQNTIYLILNISNEYLFNSLNKILISQNIYSDILANKQYNLDNTNYNNILSTIPYFFTNYCLSYNLNINSDCIKNHLYTFLGYPINNNFLNNLKNNLDNKRIIVLSFNENNYQELNVIIKYLKNNNYSFTTADRIIDK